MRYRGEQHNKESIRDGKNFKLKSRRLCMNIKGYIHLYDIMMRYVTRGKTKE